VTDVTTALAVTLGLVAGALAGLVFFGGLAATVRRLPDSSRPVALVVGSLVGRFATLAVIMAGLARLGPAPLIAGVVALLVVRTVLVRRSVPLATGGRTR